MNIYNFKPLWIELVDEQKEELGRELTNDEVANIKEATQTSINMLSLLYNNDNFQNTMLEYKITESLLNKLSDNWHQRMAKRALLWNQNVLKLEDIYKGRMRSSSVYDYVDRTN